MIRCAALALLCLLCPSLQSQQPAPPAPDAAPLPPIAELLAAVEKHEKRDEAVLRKYTFHMHNVFEEFDGDESVKKTTSMDYESIPVDNVRIGKLVAKDGKPLTPDEARKEDEEFDKRVEAAKKRRAKREEKVAEAQSKKPEGEKSGGTLLSASRVLELGDFSNERRVLLNGRSTLVLDFTGKKGAKTRDPLEKIIEDLIGTVWIDEQDKVIARTEGRFINDFKVGFGLIADLHKGLYFTFEQQKINSEIWLPKNFAGQGKASILVAVFRVHGRTRTEFSDYRKYRTTSTIIGTSDALGPNDQPLPEPVPPTPLPKP